MLIISDIQAGAGPTNPICLFGQASVRCSTWNSWNQQMYYAAVMQELASKVACQTASKGFLGTLVPLVHVHLVLE